MGSSLFSVANAEKVDAAAVSSFRATNFTASNLVVASQGLGVGELSSLAKCFTSGAATHAAPKAAASPFKGGDSRLRTDATTTLFALALPVSAAHSAAAEVAAEVLSARLSSKEGVLAQGFATSYTDGGLVGVYAAAPATSAGSAVTSLAQDLKALATAAPTANEIAAATAKIALQRALSIESSCTSHIIAAAVAKTTPAALVSAASAVTAEQVQSIIAAGAKSSTGIAFASVGPTANLPRYDAITKILA